MCLRTLKGGLEEPVSIERLVAERAAAEVSPQIEIFELRARADFEVPGEQRQKDIVPRRERVEQGADPRHDALARPWLDNFLRKVCPIRRTEALEAIGVVGQAMSGDGLSDDPRVRAAGHRQRAERIGDAELILEGARQRSSAGATRQNKCTVDVEEKEGG